MCSGIIGHCHRQRRACAHVTGLRRLDLAGNRLTAVAGLPPGGALEELCLDRNAIKALDVLSFSGALALR